MNSYWWWSSGAEANGDSGVEIGQSLRFRGNQTLTSPTFGSANTFGDNWSISFWVKLAGPINTTRQIIATGTRTAGGNYSILSLNDGTQGQLQLQGNSTFTCPGLLRDPSAWYHIFMNDDGTWINGVQQFDGANSVRWDRFNGNDIFGFSNWGGSPNSRATMYLADVYLVQQTLQPEAFGRENSDKVWVPREVDFTPAGMRNSDFVFSTADNGSGAPADLNTTDRSNITFAQNGFDNNPATFCVNSDSSNTGWTVFRPENAIPVSSSLVIRCTRTGQIWLNGADSGVDNDQNAVQDITVPLNGATSITSIALQNSATVNLANRFAQIIVDGKTITNPFLWSADLTSPSGFDANGPGPAFNGSDTNQASALLGGPTNPLTFAPTTAINYNQLEVHNTTTVMDIAIGGTTVRSNGGWVLVENAAGTISATRPLTITPTTTATATLSAIRINGTQVLIDGVNNSYGPNGFRLQFADPDDLGHDSSGNQNHFTPSAGFNTDPVGIFSNDLTTNTSFSGANPPSQAFDNNTNTFCLANGVGGTNTTITFAPATAIALTSLQVFSPGFTDQTITFGGQTTNLTPASTWVPINIGTATEISSTSTLVLTRSTAGETARLVAIRVNGAPANGLVDNPGADYDLMQDSPTQNYATFSPALPTASTAFSDGNLRVTSSDNTGPRSAPAPFGLRGRSYWEVRVVNNSSTQIGICRIDNFQPTTNNYSTSNGCIITPNGNLYNFGTLTAGGSFTYAAGDVIGFDYNPANNRLTFTRNGGNAFTVTLGETHLMVPLHAGDTTGQTTANFGQQPFLHRPAALTDANNVQTQNLPAATIRNGRDHFRAITGAGSGVGDNPAPDQTGGDWSRYLTNDFGNQWVNTREPIAAFNYANNSATVEAGAPADTILKFEPDGGIVFADTVRFATNHSSTSPGEFRVNGGAWQAVPSSGFGASLPSDHLTHGATALSGGGTLTTFELRRAENADTPSLYWVEVDGKILVDAGILSIAQSVFSSGLWWVKARKTDANTNQHQLVDSVRGSTVASTCPQSVKNTTYTEPAGDSVAWCWNAADPTTSGFNIIEFTGDANSTQAVAHGLPGTPEFVITASQGAAPGGFETFHVGCAAGQSVTIDASRAQRTSSRYSGVDATNITYGGDYNNNSQLMIAYAWTSIPGYSAFGVYQGNNNTNGPVIVTGFRPAVVLLKCAGEGSDWIMLDTTRDINNPADTRLRPNQQAGENQQANNAIDILANGFKIRGEQTNVNENDQPLIWAAWAEMPFGSSNTSPANAR